MRILYSCVIENRMISSEAGRNDLGKIAKAIVDRIEPHARKSYGHNEYSINYLSGSSNSFLAIADKDMNTKVVFAFLEKIKQKYSTEETIYFDRVLSEQMRIYSNQSVDKTTAIQREISSVKEIMMENISQILRRGERLEDLVEKTENIVAEANMFQQQSTSLKRTMWWRNVKLWIIVIIVVIVILLIILFSVCGFTFSRC